MKRKIINPFALIKSNDYQCIGCSPNNADGFNLQFFQEDDFLISHWQPTKKFEGYLNVVHGGIQATLLDEIAGWVVYTQCNTAGVTKSINVQFHNPLFIKDSPITIKGRLISQTGNEAVIYSQIFSSDDKLCSEANVIYFIYPEAIARHKYHYPGQAAFFEKD